MQCLRVDKKATFKEREGAFAWLSPQTMSRVQSAPGCRFFEAWSFVISGRTLRGAVAKNNVSGFDYISPGRKCSKEDYLPPGAEEQNTQTHPKGSEVMHRKAIDYNHQ